MKLTVISRSYKRDDDEVNEIDFILNGTRFFTDFNRHKPTKTLNEFIAEIRKNSGHEDFEYQFFNEILESISDEDSFEFIYTNKETE